MSVKMCDGVSDYREIGRLRQGVVGIPFLEARLRSRIVRPRNARTGIQLAIEDHCESSVPYIWLLRSGVVDAASESSKPVRINKAKEAAP